MRKFRDIQSRNHQYLLPPSLDELVGSDDIVRYVDAVIDELNLSSIESHYSTLGRPAFSPRTLVKLLVYGKMRGIRSSRELSRACCENLRFIYLVCNERPDFRTISLFRERFHEELASLMKQTIKLGMDKGIIYPKRFRFPDLIEQHTHLSS